MTIFLKFKFVYVLLGMLWLTGCMPPEAIYIKISPEPSPLTPSISISFEEDFTSEAVIKTIKISSDSNDKDFPAGKDFFWVISSTDYENGNDLLTVVYGKAPKDFYEVIPPKPLEVNKSYYIEAVGPYSVSSSGVFRIKKAGNKVTVECDNEDFVVCE